jgi:hypothetical protein
MVIVLWVRATASEIAETGLCRAVENHQNFIRGANRASVGAARGRG